MNAFLERMHNGGIGYKPPYAALAILSGILLGASIAHADVDPATHEKCLKAADYAGCVNMQVTGVKALGAAQEECDEVGSCIAGRGEDRLGLPKITGWKYEVQPDGTVMYVEIFGKDNKVQGGFRSRYYLVPHKGQKRYVARRIVVHWYDQGAGSTPGHTQTFGGGSTTCNSYGMYGSATTYCNTVRPVEVFIPGSPGRAAGPRSLSGVHVVDCVDRTWSLYEEGQKPRHVWRKVVELPWACSELDSLQVLNMEL